MSRLLRLACTAAVGLLLLSPLHARAQATPEPATSLSAKLLPGDPQAIALLTEMVRAYQGLNSYAATETTTSPTNTRGSYRMALTYARPDRAGVEVTRGEGKDTTTLRVVSDGKNYFASNSEYPKRYLKTTPSPGKPVLNQVLDATASQGNLPAAFLEDGDRMLKSMTGPNGNTSIRMDEPGIVDGVAVDTIILEQSDPNWQSTTLLQMSRDDHLLRRVQTSEGNPGQPRQIIIQTFTDVRTNFAAPASLFAFTPPVGAEAMAPVGAVQPDPKAVVLMSQMFATYKALNSFSCTAQMESVSPLHDSHGKVVTLRSASSGSYQFMKPNKIAFSRTNNQGTARAVCDGQTLYAITTEHPGGTEAWRAQPRYLKQAAPATGDPRNDNLKLANFGGLPIYSATGSLRWMPEIVLGIEMMSADGGDSFQLGVPTVLNGEPVEVVFVQEQSVYLGGIPSEDKMIFTLCIGQHDHLLRQVSHEWTRPIGTNRSVETYTDIKVNPILPPSTFEFIPPANAIAVDTVEALLPPQTVMGPKLHVGDAAPATVFGTTDIYGQPIKAEDYAGKVLLLDFWGTWCPPCIQQMPAFVAAYRKYHDQGLEIIDYALEESKDKDKLPAFTAKRNMEWRHVWDKDAAIFNACGPTNGVPFIIIIGRDGRVAAVGAPREEGVEGGLDVEAEIRAALAKPIPIAYEH